jgi:hypothetical protein
MRRLIMIVAALPPGVDGASDYAPALARGLRQCHAIESVFKHMRSS